MAQECAISAQLLKNYFFKNQLLIYPAGNYCNSSRFEKKSVETAL